jgi:cyclopropane-fatty-acyl-phospholipid synthase
MSASPLPAAVERMLQRRIKRGRLKVKIGVRLSREFGDGDGPELIVEALPAALLRLLRAPSSLTLGECYMDGGIRVEEGEVFDLVALIGRNSRFQPRPETFAKWAWRQLRQRNGRGAARRNAAHHYDLSVALYRLFLDADLQYSCAFFASPDMTLEEAQAAKRERIARKLLLGPGMRVLDIGCGWGGLGLELARRDGAAVLGVTLSREQRDVAQARAAEVGLAGQARFECCDYREVAGSFDRVVSVGMLEHVGSANFDSYFRKIAELLPAGGVALVHSICRKHGPGVTNPFLDRYIFPGGYIPLLSEVLPAVERAGLQIADVELWRLHYATTLACWRLRFAEHRQEIAELYDERFCRMWEYYLAISEVAFRWAGYAVFQLQLTKAPDAVPITRAYLAGEPDSARPPEP